MIRHGKVTLPSGDKEFGLAWGKWRHSQILSRGLLDEAAVVTVFRTVEDTREDAVPVTTAVNHSTNQAEKSAQLGPDAGASLLRGVLKQFSGTGSAKPVAVIVDLNAHTGDLGTAVLEERFNSACGCNIYYVGFHSSTVEARCCIH